MDFNVLLTAQGHQREKEARRKREREVWGWGGEGIIRTVLDEVK